MKMVRSAAESRKHAKTGHKDLPRFGPPWWCNTLLLHVWDCSGGDDHGELTSLGVREWPTASMVPWLALNYYGLGPLPPHLGEGIPHAAIFVGTNLPLILTKATCPDKGGDQAVVAFGLAFILEWSAS